MLIITNYRIVQLNKSIYLDDSKDAIDLPKIQDIEKKQHGILRNFMNFGNLVIILSSSSNTKIIHDLPNPDYYFRKINKLKRDYIKDRLDRKHRDINADENITIQKEQIENYPFIAKK